MNREIITTTESDREKDVRNELISKLIEFKNYKIMSRSETLLNSLKEYLNGENMERILPILIGESKISIRVIEWFVTNYCKKKNIAYIRSDKNNKEAYFNVYLNYKSQLKSYNKDLFDPFCRGEELINFPIKDNKYIVNPKFVEKCHISLSDFGAFCNEDEHYDEEFGTRYYRAPEIILMGDCSYAVDIWAAGCVFYVLP